MVVTKRKRAHYFGLPENRESITAIEAISAAGDYIPAFLLLAGTWHMGSWYEVPELEAETVLRPTPTAYTNNEISFEWIQHFYKYTISKRKGQSTLLIVDGHGSHCTLEVITFCEEHGILLFPLPPHLTHLLQPLDVSVFQPLKHFQSKAVDKLVRDDAISLSKLDFLSYIGEVRKQAFKKNTILSGFKRAGIYPFNSSLS